jgi:hypothetical protein
MSHLDYSDEECNNINYKLYEKIKVNKYCDNNYCNRSDSASESDCDNDNNSSCSGSIYAKNENNENELHLGQVLYYDGKENTKIIVSNRLMP